MAIATWCEFVQSGCSAQEALAQIALITGTDAVALSRYNKRSGKSALVAFDAMSAVDTAKLSESYAPAILGSFVNGAAPGSVWLRSALPYSPVPHLDAFQSRRGFREMVIIPLEQDPVHLDALEIHLRADRGVQEFSVLNGISQSISSTWRNRRSGVFTSQVLERASAGNPGDPDLPLLGCQNPAKLSRAEFRVCLLLSRGKSKKRVCKELDISDATLRTHLRNIYAKTDCANQAELTYKLMSTQSETVAAMACA